MRLIPEKSNSPKKPTSKNSTMQGFKSGVSSAYEVAGNATPKNHTNSKNSTMRD